KEIEICHDDGFACEDGETNTYECPHCGKNFILTTSISINHDAYEAPCLNGVPHNMRPINGAPAAFFVRKTRCTCCGHTETDKAANDAAMAEYFAPGAGEKGAQP